GIALPRPLRAVGSNGSNGPDLHYTRAKPCGLARDPAASVELLGVELDDQLFLRCDRNARTLRALQHPAAERLLVDRQPREGSTARCLVHRSGDRRHLTGLLANAN